MTADSAVEHVELELKYEAASGLPVPTEWPAGLVETAVERYELRAVYFDSPARALARAGLALRRRSGGSDAGWHLKSRLADDVQQERQWEYSEALPESVAQTLHEAVPGVVEHLQIVAEIHTERTARTLCRDGEPVIEFADDRVVATDRAAGVTRAWREWEGEVIAPSPVDDAAQHALLDALREVFRLAGAVPSLADSKIGRAAGSLLPRAIATGKPEETIAALSVQDTADRIAGAAAAAHNAATAAAPADSGGDVEADGDAAARADASMSEHAAAETAHAAELRRADRLRAIAQRLVGLGDGEEV